MGENEDDEINSTSLGTEIITLYLLRTISFLETSSLNPDRVTTDVTPCRFRPNCVSGYDGFVSAFVFAVATQQTIGALLDTSSTDNLHDLGLG